MALKPAAMAVAMTSRLSPVYGNAAKVCVAAAFACAVRTSIAKVTVAAFHGRVCRLFFNSLLSPADEDQLQPGGFNHAFVVFDRHDTEISPRSPCATYIVVAFAHSLPVGPKRTA